jgi:DNA repair protein RadD
MELDRADVIDLYKARGFQALVSVETLTTGFDAPNVDLIALMRPTMSPVLHVQMIGRGLRKAEGKENCLVLDYAGNVERLGPVNKVKAPKPGIKKGTGEAPTKVCPECDEIVHMAATVCPACHYEFPINHKLTPSAALVEIIQTKFINRFEVDWVQYMAYDARSGRCIRVDYKCGLRTFNEYVMIEGSNFALHKAKHWWKVRHPDPSTIPPSTVEEALTGLMIKGFRKPTALIVDESGKYPQIKQYIWE